MSGRDAPSMHRTVWLAIGLHLLLVFGSAAVAPAVNQPGESYTSPAAGELMYPFERMVRWDAPWYHDIAATGYTERLAAFFPALPMSMRAVSLNGRINLYAVGLAISNLCMVAVFYLVWRLGAMQFGQKVARRAVFAVALMPMSVFFNSIYTESMFLMFVLTSLWLARQERWWLAGVAGALAAATRNLGLAMAGVLVIEAWFMYRRPCRAMAAGFIVPLGLLGFMAYHAAVLGDPLAFLHAQDHWGRRFQWPWESLYLGAQSLAHSIRVSHIASTNRFGQDLVLTLIWIGLLLWAALDRKLKVPVSWQVLSWLLIITPLFSGHPGAPLYSMARFALVVPVAYFMVARLPNPVYVGFLILGGATLIINTVFFTIWKFIG